mmetsp:Transcript_19165/g.28650  ORF Transcript_19165/g.28650 Transcript_19165/m.28650 type:complete len:90 (-) Transcript_19165:228-497(-)
MYSTFILITGAAVPWDTRAQSSSLDLSFSDYCRTPFYEQEKRSCVNPTGKRVFPSFRLRSLLDIESSNTLLFGDLPPAPNSYGLALFFL